MRTHTHVYVCFKEMLNEIIEKSKIFNVHLIEENSYFKPFNAYAYFIYKVIKCFLFKSNHIETYSVNSS